MRKAILSILTIFVFFGGYSQNNLEQKFLEAKKFQNNYQFKKSISLYSDVLKQDSSNANISYNIGMMYFYLNQTDSALYFMDKASKNINKKHKNSFDNKSAPIETWFILADLHQAKYEFDDALVCLDSMLKYTESKKFIADINRKKEECQKGIEFISTPLDLTVMPLHKTINSPYREHSPVVTADLQTLIFTSTRKGTGEKKDENGNYYEDIYICKRKNGVWTDPESISKNINTEEHEASVGLSADGKILYIYKEAGGGDIYESNLKNNEWTEPKPLSINSNYRETHASISQDGNTIYFSSDRPGGEGGLDIYYAQKKENGKWGKAINLGKEINTPYDDDGPYINADDSTLFFSSEGHLGMGNFDLYMTKLQKDGVWTKPKNLGYPANSPGDDIYYIASPGGSYAFYVSSQPGTINNTDIYFMMLPDKERARLGVLSGKIKVSHELADTAKVDIFVINPETGDTVKTYQTDKQSGDYTMVLTADNVYVVIYQADGFVTETEEFWVKPDAELQTSKKVIPLQEVELGKANTSYKIEFLPNTDTLTYKSIILLNETANDLKKYDELVPEISVPQSDELRNERTKSILNYFAGQEVDTANVHITTSKSNFFEILVADSVFLDYKSNNWQVEFDQEDKSPEIENISNIELDRMCYFLDKNPELYVEIPMTKNDTSKTRYEQSIEIFEYMTQKGVDTSRFVVNFSEEQSQSDKIMFLNLNADTTGTIPLLEVNKTFEAKFLRKNLINVPVFIVDTNFFAVKHAYEIKEYFAKRGLDTNRVNFLPYNFNEPDMNMVREKILKEAETANSEKIADESFVFVPFYSKQNFTKYESIVPADDQNQPFVHRTSNGLKDQMPIDRNYKDYEQPEIPIVPINKCGYLYANIGMPFHQVLFGYNQYKTTLTQGLDSIAICLKNNPNLTIELAGHTDSKGSAANNIELGKKRANFIKTYLQSKGAQENQITTVSFGEAKPVAPNNIQGQDYPQGRQQNRRVELRVLDSNSRLAAI